MYSVKQSFDRNNNSDILMLMIAYCEWRDKFTDRNVHNLNRERQVINRITSHEREFCKKNFLDPILLKETHRLVADLKLKLKRLGIFDAGHPTMNLDLDFEDLNEVTYFDFNEFINDPRQVTLFKYVLGGAFYGKYIKCQYSNIDKVRKDIRESSVKSNLDVKKTVVLKK